VQNSVCHRCITPPQGWRCTDPRPPGVGGWGGHGSGVGWACGPRGRTGGPGRRWRQPQPPGPHGRERGGAGGSRPSAARTKRSGPCWWWRASQHDRAAAWTKPTAPRSMLPALAGADGRAGRASVGGSHSRPVRTAGSAVVLVVADHHQPGQSGSGPCWWWRASQHDRAAAWTKPTAPRSMLPALGESGRTGGPGRRWRQPQPPGPHGRERRGRGLFVGGDCVCGGIPHTHTLVGGVSASQRHRNRRRQPEPQQAAQRCCSEGGARTNVAGYNDP
jgi:hypothetical protein